MMQRYAKGTAYYLAAFIRWTIGGLLVGAVCGTVGGLFAMAVEKVTELRQENAWLLYLLPVGGLLIAGFYRLMKLPLSLGTDEIITTCRTQGKVPFLMAPAIFLSTVLTHLLGGSAGREGAALQLGGSIGAAIGDLSRPKSDSRRIFELCGMAALFSALFGTPLTATIFVLEVIEVGKINNRALLPCLISSVAAKLTAQWIGAPVEVFPLGEGLQATDALSLLKAIGFGAVCAAVASFFCIVMHFAQKRVRRLLPNDFLRIGLGGVVVVILSLLVGTRDYNGGGMHVIFAALEGRARPEAFLLKIVFTALTLSVGFKGGEIVPAFFVGSTLGCTIAPLLGFSPEVGAAVGLVALFCGVTNSPLASMMLGVELFGTEYLPLIAVAAVVSFMLSGHFSLYHSQLFTVPKLGSREKLPAEDTIGMMN